MENRKMIFTTKREHLALMMKDKLGAEGIEAIVLNHGSFDIGTFESVELYVLNEDADKSKLIIDANQEEEE
jgi:hypothetical protein